MMTGMKHKIPNDTGHPWRLEKFVEYQHEVPSIHYRTLGEYVKTHTLSVDDAVVLCWYCSMTYNEVTSIILHKMIDWRSLQPQELSEFWEKYKPVLNFGSSRKYAKNMDWFVPLMKSFMKRVKRKPYFWLRSFEKDDAEETYRALEKELRGIQYCGRFATDIFMECILYLADYLDFNIAEPLRCDWKNMSNLTSGLLNIFYRDEEADLFDKKGELRVSQDWLQEKLLEVQACIKKTYPEQDCEIPMFIGKICSFRNLFKNARYGGFHHDRQLGVLKEYEKTMPEQSQTLAEIYALRRAMFHERFLGELGGWDGIRKERKKLWLTQGLTGVEDI